MLLRIQDGFERGLTLSHEPGHGAACARYQMQDLLAAGLAFERR